MIEVNPKVVIVGVVWIALGSVINKTMGMETLQLYVICSLVFLFVRYGTANRKRRPGEASPYEFLNPKAEELADEVVPFVAIERLKKVLGVESEDKIPNQNTEVGAQLRKMVSRQPNTSSALFVISEMRKMTKAPERNDLCLCGSELKFVKCCPDLLEYLVKEEGKKK